MKPTPPGVEEEKTVPEIEAVPETPEFRPPTVVPEVEEIPKVPSRRRPVVLLVGGPTAPHPDVVLMCTARFGVSLEWVAVTRTQEKQAEAAAMRIANGSIHGAIVVFTCVGHSVQEKIKAALNSRKLPLEYARANNSASVAKAVRAILQRNPPSA